MKTLEFGLSFNSRQSETLDRWLETLRWVWNDALSLCLEFDRYSAWDKQSKSWVPCCPRFGEEKVRWIKDGETWVAAPYSPISTKRNPTRMFCPLPPSREYREPKLNNISEFSLAAQYAHKRHPDKPWLKEIPANFIRGVTQALATAWKAFKKGERGEPRFKGKGNPLETLSNNDAKILKREGDRLKIPNLGWLKLRGLAQRWKDATICSLRISRSPSGWVAQLSGYTAEDEQVNVEPKDDKPVPKPIQERSFPKPSQLVAGVALIGRGGAHHSTDLKTQSVKVVDEREAKKLERLQRKLSRQVYLSNRWQQTKQLIGKLHEKIRLRRRNINHKLSTFLVRTFATLVIQKVKKLGPKERPEPIPVNVDPPQWAPNGAEERSRKNKFLANLGQGQFIDLVKQKAKKAGREIIEVSGRTELAGTELAKKLKQDFLVTQEGNAIDLLHKLKEKKPPT